MPTERRRVHYAGRVQGVGFRFTAQRLAQGFDVCGYVRNLPDARVEVYAIGTPDQLANLRATLQRGPRFARVSQVQE